MGGIKGSLEEGRKNILLTFIWKNDDSNPFVMYLPDEKTKVFGDANIAKYLATSLAADLYSSRSKQEITEIDAWIEVANQINTGNNTEKEAAMRQLDDHLTKSTFLVAGSRTLA